VSAARLGKVTCCTPEPRTRGKGSNLFLGSDCSGKSLCASDHPVKHDTDRPRSSCEFIASLMDIPRSETQGSAVAGGSYLSESSKFTLAVPLAGTMTFSSQVFGSAKIGRRTS
jgi:hypothetical protein